MFCDISVPSCRKFNVNFGWFRFHSPLVSLLSWFNMHFYILTSHIQIYVTWHSVPVHFWEHSVEKWRELFSNSALMLQFFGGFCMCRWGGLRRSVVLSKSSMWRAFYKGPTRNFHLVLILVAPVGRSFQLLHFSPAVEWQLDLCFRQWSVMSLLRLFLFFVTFFLFFSPCWSCRSILHNPKI